MTFPVAFGFVVGALVVLWVSFVILRGMFEDVGIEKSCAKANIVTDFAPCADKNIFEGSRIRIVGCEGYGLFVDVKEEDSSETKEKNYKWRTWLRKWVERGARIEYLLVLPTNETEQGFANPPLSNDQNLPDKAKLAPLLEGIDFRAFPKALTKEIDPDTRKTVRRMRTFHFVLIDPPKEKTVGSKVWIERNHPIGETFALGCEYSDVRKAKYKSQYEEMSDIFGDLFDIAWDQDRLAACLSEKQRQPSTAAKLKD